MLDTSVIVAAFRSRSGASNELVRLTARRRITALVTPALFLEYEDVFMRPEQRSAHGLSVRDVDRVLASLASVIEPVTLHIAWRPQLRDPSDEMVLEAAINGRADALVTFNVGDFLPARRFGLLVARPAGILDKVKT